MMKSRFASMQKSQTGSLSKHPSSKFIDAGWQTDTRFVRVIWVDLANFVRYRVVPYSHFLSFIDSDGPGHKVANDGHEANDKENKNVLVKTNPRHIGMRLAKAALGIVYLSLAEGFPIAAEYIFVPDLSSVRRLGFQHGSVGVFGWFEEKEKEVASEDTLGLSPFAAPVCPRAVLHKIVSKAKSSEEVDFLIGFETEVIFLESIDPIKAVNDYGWSESGAILAGQKPAIALEEIAMALETAGIELQMYHSEAAPGQYEIITGPLPPLEACDALIITREIIRNITAKHGLHATLAPRVYSNSCGTAAHTHISLKSTSTTWAGAKPPATAGGHISALESSFVAGLLAHLRGATAFTLPTRASYARMVDGAWSGGTWVAWGRDNREAPVRMCGGGGSAVHFEVKSVDGTANPYLAVAALLAAGMEGVKTRKVLEVRGVGLPPSVLSEEERASAGVVTRMPLTIEEACAALEGDEVLKQALGGEFVKAFLSVNKTLNEQLQASTEEEAMIKLIKTF